LAADLRLEDAGQGREDAVLIGGFRSVRSEYCGADSLGETLIRLADFGEADATAFSILQWLIYCLEGFLRCH